MFALWQGNLPDTEESRRAARVGGADPARLGLSQFVAERDIHIREVVGGTVGFRASQRHRSGERRSVARRPL
jgi:hypothetical protein